jgi:hypothetical protein
MKKNRFQILKKEISPLPPPETEYSSDHLWLSTELKLSNNKITKE